MHINKTSKLVLFFIVAAICITASYSIVYTQIQYFSYSSLGGNEDALRYLAMYRGEKLGMPWRFRVLIPFFAKILPDPPRMLFSENRVISDLWIAKIKFGIINFLFLILIGILFFYFMNALGLSILESFIGVLLFYTARPIVQNIGPPVIDAAAYFFLLLCLYALKRQNLILLVIGFYIGIFVKETIFFIFPAILFSQFKHKIRALFSLVPITIIYLFIRFYIYPDPADDFFRLKYIFFFKDQLFALFHFNTMLDLFSSFGLLWIPAIYALTLTKLPLLLKRWSWLAIIILVMTILLNDGGNFGRHSFNAFPIVIPLAMYGIHYVLEYCKRNGFK